MVSDSLAMFVAHFRSLQQVWPTVNRGMDCGMGID